MLRELVHDVRYALRLGRRNIGVAIFAILPLSLAIGGTIAVFTVMYAFLRPLPVFEPDRLVEVAHTRGVNLHPYAMWTQLRERQDVLSGVFAYYAWNDSLELAERGENQPLQALFVSGEAFHVLDVPAVLGRTLEPMDDRPGAAPVCMISYGLWNRQYGRAPSVLGRAMVLNGQVFQIIGVAPSWFLGLESGTKPDAFLPLETRRMFTNQRFSSGVSMPGLEASNALSFIGRLKDGMSTAQADARLRILGAGIYPTLPPEHRMSGTLSARPLSRGILWSYSGDTLRVMMIMAGILLFIACANSANLLLAWAKRRQGEMGVRLALGASRWRLIKQLLTESIVLSVVATAFGVVFAMWARKAIVSAISFSDTPASLNFSVDGKLVVFVIGIAAVCALLSGLTPALAASRVSFDSAVNNSIRGGRRGSSFSNSVLIVVQVALSVAVFVSACLLTRTYHNLVAKDPGYDPKGVLVAEVNSTTKSSDSRRAVFESEQLLQEFRRTPGVVTASRFANSPRNTLLQLGIPQIGGSVLLTRAYGFFISSDYFRTRRTPILAGRDFDLSDTADSEPVAILSEQAAKRFFKEANPIGLSFRNSESGTTKGGQSIKVVGVAKDIDFQRPQDAPLPVVFRPASQCSECDPMGRYEIRLSGPLPPMTARLKASACTVSPSLAVKFHSLGDEVSSRLALNRAAALLSLLFGIIVGLLMAMGVYAMTSYAAVQRTREIGIRMALGARRGSVVRMILRDSLWAVFAGTMVGILAAFSVVQTLRGMVWGFEPTDLSTFTAAVALVLIATGTAACVPAFRAVRSEPSECLRHE